MNQIILSIIANAGGVGKSTLATHLAYDLAIRKEHSVALIDLDPQRSLDVFCGLKHAEPTQSITSVLSQDFKGEWPLATAWEIDKVSVCQGHQTIEQTARTLVIHPRGHYSLSDRLKKYPLPHEVVIVDCPATLGLLISNALAAATHIIIPLQLEPKAVQGASDVIRWYINQSLDLGLDPRPDLLGFVPSAYEGGTAMHRQLLEQLPALAKQLNTKMYPHIRNSKEFVNASGQGLPLQMFRPGHKANQDFHEISNDLSRLING